MPTWTDIGGFWVSAGGFGLAIALAVIGWAQAHGAKADAATAEKQAAAAKEQADAARDIAEQAQRQTAAAEAAAEAVKEQAEVAFAALDWETVPQLTVVANKRHKQMIIGGTERKRVITSDWYISNNGKATAHRLSVRLDFGSDTQIALGPLRIQRLEGGEHRQLGLYGVVMPAFEDLLEAGFVPRARLTYDTPTGETVDKYVEVLPTEQR